MVESLVQEEQQTYRRNLPHHSGRAVRGGTQQMTTDFALITDAELCKLLSISPVTLRKHLREGPPRKRYCDTGDLRMIQHIAVGGQRRWIMESVEKFIKGGNCVNEDDTAQAQAHVAPER
jgi:hypothetical protein